MLKEQNRLKKKKDFDNVFKKGKSLKDGFLIFKFVQNSLNESRFAFMVGKKISKKATERNKVQRKLREQLRLMFYRVKEGIDGVFIALPGLENSDSLATKELLEKILAKAKALKK